MNLRPHSLRRGGATAYYRLTGGLSRTMKRGRWASASVARLCIQDGLATDMENYLSVQQRLRLQQDADEVRAFLRNF